MSMLSRRALVVHLAGVRYASPRAKTPLGGRQHGWDWAAERSSRPNGFRRRTWAILYGRRYYL